MHKVNHQNRRSSGTNGTGGAAGPTPPGEHRRIRINHTKITPGCTRDASGRTRTHQDTSSITTDNTRTHRTTQDLKRQTEGEPGRAGPRRTIRSWKPQRQEKHRLPRTHSFASHARTKRNDFPVGSAQSAQAPQPPICLEIYTETPVDMIASPLLLECCAMDWWLA